ncbi:MAG: DUF5706 domain-containing protein [Acidobacteria bacterium]|nr:DUF5706 domain-containing protein [Acidobacteriota bacterium]MDA1236887.1 DUF5706 domain-containing protein [Acidobacteriota bacterium]
MTKATDSLSPNGSERRRDRNRGGVITVEPDGAHQAEVESETTARRQEKKLAKKAAGKVKKAAVKEDVGTSRGIESMFRSSYRTQLSMIALAATKANIMISINGFLLSMLTVSSAYVLATEPTLLIPTATLVATAVLSITFAVLAARPQAHPKIGARTDFRGHNAELLIFEDFSQLTKGDYVEEMLELMLDQERVYTAMISQLHFLGQSADRRFKMLRLSYGAFLFGVLTSFVALICVAISVYA